MLTAASRTSRDLGRSGQTYVHNQQLQWVSTSLFTPGSEPSLGLVSNLSLMVNRCIWRGVNRRHEQTSIGAVHLWVLDARAQRNFRQFRDYSARDILLTVLLLTILAAKQLKNRKKKMANFWPAKSLKV